MLLHFIFTSVYKWLRYIHIITDCYIQFDTQRTLTAHSPLNLSLLGYGGSDGYHLHSLVWLDVEVDRCEW